jgi:glycosyltransferase involved in cell wall biosynthesis
VKILHLIDHMGLGGSQTLLLDTLEVRDRSDEHRVWTLTDQTLDETARRLKETAVTCHSLVLSKLDPLAPLGIRSMIAAQRPDVLHTYLDNSNSIGVAAALCVGRSRPRVVSQIENDPGQHYGALQRFLLGRVAARVDAHVFVSESLRQSSQIVLRGRCRRTEVVHPAIDLERFDPALANVNAVRRIRNGAGVVVGSVGRLADQKGYDVLLDATPALLEADPGIRILIVGDGPRRGALQDRARRLGVGHAVTLAGYRSDVETALAAMDVFVLPSRHEGFGIVAIEAMAMNVPVVATRIVGTVDSVGEQRGVLVPPEDAPALAAAILQVLADGELRRRLVDTGAEWVRRACNRGAATAQIRALYEEIVRAAESA